MTKKFLNLKAQWNPGRINLKKTVPEHIVTKLIKTKDKEKNSKSNQIKKDTLHIEQELANYGPWVKSGLILVSVNKI